MTQEQFDAMTDADFKAHWNARMEAVQASATSEDEVQAEQAEQTAAWERRWRGA